MSAIPGGVDTEQQPPMTVPLRHFLVGLGFLLAGLLVGLGQVGGVVPGRAALAHVHLLLVGWVCLTILGAMTQFVPVWSGVTLHSRRLATLQLVLVALGLAGFVVALVANALAWLVPFGATMVAGFWIFAYNVGRTLARVDGLDVTERHFALALAFFVLVTALGFLLAADFSVPLFGPTAVEDALGLGTIARADVVAAHATLAVFGAILTTVYGALYQLATMFTQTELHGVDESLRRVEEVSHPAGVVLLATGRLVGWSLPARAGGVLVVVAALAVSAILARKLVEMRVERTPMHTRYAVVVPALTGWALLTLPTWLRAPASHAHLFGAPGAAHLLALGAVGFVVFGTLYHVVPFVVWVHRYSDLLGFEDVPMIDDLYSDRLAAFDGTALLAGTALLVASELVAAPPIVRGLAGALVALGAVVFAANLLGVVRRHGPHSLTTVLLGALAPGDGGGNRTGDGGLEDGSAGRPPADEGAE